MDNLNLKNEIIDKYIKYCNLNSNNKNELDEVKIKNLMNAIIDIKTFDEDPKYLLLMKNFMNEKKSVSLKFANINFKTGISLILDCFSLAEENILIIALLYLLNDFYNAFVVKFGEIETKVIRYLYLKRNQDGVSFHEIYEYISNESPISKEELKSSITKLMDVHTIIMDDQSQKYSLAETVISNI